MKKENQSVVENIILQTPIVRGEQIITEIALRKPQAGELRNINLMDMVQMNVSAMTTLLPRISIPSLTEHDISQMDPADLFDCAAKVTGFLLKTQTENSPVA